MCLQPIWIANRRYIRKDHDISLPMSELAQRPWDVSRFRLAVPCGKCEECQKALRNSWYVRIRQELSRCRADNEEAWFVTITIDPRYYKRAFDDPTWFMRKWFERIRHVTGRTIKHVFFQEFGMHSLSGSEPRLHFHGFLFAPRMSYNEFRSIISKFGHVWLCQATAKRARYAVKYVVKHLNTSNYDLPDALRITLSDRKYSRKYVSPGLGDYIANQPHPDISRGTWTFDARLSDSGYQYKIPRYYDKYLSEKEKTRRSILSASSYASYLGDSVVISFLRDVAQRFSIDPSSLAFEKGYFSQYINYLNKSKATVIRGVPWISTEFSKVLDVWRSAFGLDASPDVIFNKSLTYG